MDKDELVSLILKLQKQIATATQAPPSPPATPALSKEDLQRKVAKARDMMEKGIKSQMKVFYPLGRCTLLEVVMGLTLSHSGSHRAKAAVQGSPTRASWPPLAFSLLYFG